MTFEEINAYIEQVNELKQTVKKLERDLASAHDNHADKDIITVQKRHLNASTAREAIVLHEIIGPAVSKRRRVR